MFLVGLAAGGLLNLAFSAPAARANFFEDLLKNFLAPFEGSVPEVELSPPVATPGDREIPSPAARPDEREISLYQPVIDYEKAVVQAVKKASPAVVSVTVSKNVPIIENCPVNPFSDLPPEFRQFFGEEFRIDRPCERGTRYEEVGGGSGFIISSNGLILTNKHVVADERASYTAFTNDGKKYSARVLARDPIQDLAVLEIDAAGLPTVELGDSDALELGQTVIAIGNALAEFRNTVSVGVISGLSRTVVASGAGGVETIHDVIQTDAAINPGNSGGPLLNLRGQVIGINTAIASGAQNIGFAIPINHAKRDIQSVKTSGEIQVPFLGVRYRIVNEEIAREERLPVGYGALLEGSEKELAVTPGSPAEQAGLRAGDIILEINGKRISEENPLASTIGRFNVGEKIAVKVLRGGEEFTIQATLAKR
ncbi:PDZ domain-containing protein [Candidatus Parcubacteria bacterium]|nr:MAG: PDZ domain-containing protein [Candidatus Parcubacteria bacterium]